MGKELEFKYRVSLLQFRLMDHIQEEFGGQWESVHMVSTYFDTREGELENRRWTLRLRKENDVQVITCKTPGQGRARNEWECPAGELAEGIADLIAMGAPTELEQCLKDGLSPVCGADFIRLRKEICLPFGKVEIALDKGKLTGGTESCLLREVEIEFKEGVERYFPHWCENFAQRYNLRPETKSKFARANALRQRSENGNTAGEV